MGFAGHDFRGICREHDNCHVRTQSDDITAAARIEKLLQMVMLLQQP
jgi:hypothetical protein